MSTIELVCLCDQYDLKAEFGPGFEDVAPWVRAVAPSEVEAPSAIRHAMVFRPGEKAFDPYPNLRLVCSVGAGVETLVAHPGVRSDMVLSRMVDPEAAEMIAGFALWHILNWQRQMARYAEQQSQRVWKEIPHPPPSAYPVAVLGYGNIGRKIVETLKLLGFPVMAYATTAKPDSPVPVVSGVEALRGLFESSRAVINVLPLTQETRGIVSNDLLARMREDAIFVHLGRGGHLDEQGLCTALDRGRPGFAAVDVTSIEPTPADHPFWNHRKMFLTPHYSGVSSPHAVASSIAQAIQDFENGLAPKGRVDRNRGY